MKIKKIIGVGLLLFLACESALLGAGSFFMCLHDFGEAHLLPEAGIVDCCHGAETSAELHLCEDCTDLEISGLEFVLWRDQSRPFVPVAMPPPALAWVTHLPGKASAYETFLPARAPPMLGSAAQKHARTICLRV